LGALGSGARDSTCAENWSRGNLLARFTRHFSAPPVASSVVAKQILIGEVWSVTGQAVLINRKQEFPDEDYLLILDRLLSSSDLCGNGQKKSLTKESSTDCTVMDELEFYDYELPRERIAQEPLRQRADARLLMVDRENDQLVHSHVRNLPELLSAGDCLVINDTRVIPAQLVGYRVKTGGRWTGLFLNSDGMGRWSVLSKTRGKLAPGEQVMLQDPDSRDCWTLTMLASLDDGAWAVRPDAPGSCESLLEKVGRVPLPHYIRGGHMKPSDREQYQTVYAKHPGSVAAPTAGLHFTSALLKELADRGVNICRVTLHVGIGTFRPIKTETLAEHQMHSEYGVVEEAAVETIQQTQLAGGRVIAVGTTTVRLLESAAAGGEVAAWAGETDLFIRPPYEFKAIQGLVTNFHLPKSSLLVLVRTFGGDALLKRAYQEAIEQQYRFYSYGDAMLIL
jgi:S-adenosylmethionine:tRNA ribosyltransferase-isomerase